MESGQGRDNWRKSLRMRLRQFQFNWVGRTKDGVNKWIGAPKGPSERFCTYFMCYGIAMSLLCLVSTAAILAHVQVNAPLSFLALIGGIHGGIFTVMGFWLRKLARRLAPLKTVEEIAEE